MLKILQARLQQYMNHELPDVQVGFIKGRRTRDQIANIQWIIGKAREFQKNTYYMLYWLCQSLWLCGSQWTVENSLSDENTRSSYLPPEKSMQIKKQQLEPDMEQQTGSKSRKEYVKVVYCHTAYLTYMQRTSWETLGLMKHSWNQDCWEKYQ